MTSRTLVGAAQARGDRPEPLRGTVGPLAPCRRRHRRRAISTGTAREVALYERSKTESRSKARALRPRPTSRTKKAIARRPNLGTDILDTPRGK
jgi:hypothetical protein